MELRTDKMIAEKEGGIGWMIYNNPARLNAISLEMQEAIPTILDRFQTDPEVRVVVMRGNGGKAFVSGADISEFEKQRSTALARRAYDRAGGRAFASFAALEKPLIAVIQGFCMGGGLATALQADIQVASDDSQFGIPAARLGLGAGGRAARGRLERPKIAGPWGGAWFAVGPKSPYSWRVLTPR